MRQSHIIITGYRIVITNMASSPVNPSSPTGTLKRDASKKDSGKLGWVGTLTRRKKGQEGRILWLKTKTFYLEIWIIQRAIKGSWLWQLKFEVSHFLFYASLCHLIYLTRLNEESAVIFIGLVPSNFNYHFWNTLAVFDRWYAFDFCKFHREFQHFNTPFPVTKHTLDHKIFR